MSSGGRRVLSLFVALPGTAAVSNEVLQALHDGRDIVVGRARMCVVPAAKITSDGGICGSEPCTTFRAEASTLGAAGCSMNASLTQPSIRIIAARIFRRDTPRHLGARKFVVVWDVSSGHIAVGR